MVDIAVVEPARGRSGASDTVDGSVVVVHDIELEHDHHDDAAPDHDHQAPDHDQPDDDNNHHDDGASDHASHTVPPDVGVCGVEFVGAVVWSVAGICGPGA